MSGRRGALLLLAGLAGCSVLPDRPFQPVRRFALAPERPGRLPPARRGPVLLIRTFRAAPGLDQRGLRSVGADGQVMTEFWAEWAAPPADLVEEAVRRWLAASGHFAAVTAPGSRLDPALVLEGEVVRLQAEPGAGLARAGLSALVLAPGRDDARVLAQIIAEGTAPLPAGGPPTADAAAAAMVAALAEALERLEAAIVAALPTRR